MIISFKIQVIINLLTYNLLETLRSKQSVWLTLHLNYIFQNVPFIKIGSGDVNNLPLIKEGNKFII